LSAVSEIMSPKKTVALRLDRIPNALEAVKLMIKNKVGSVVVLGFDGEPAGIVTERDILKRVTAVGKSPDKVSLQDFMSKPVITIKSYDSIETAATIMSKNKIKRLVVLEQDGSLAGVISVTDVTRRLAKILMDEYNRFSHLKAALDF